MREKWFDRTFRFDIPASRMAYLIERLRGTPARIEERVRGLGDGDLRRRFGDTWSIQENIAHLTDLEDLHLSRLVELAARVAVLRAADVLNRRTWESNHNARPIADVLAEFRAGRARLVDRLEAWDPARLDDAGMHPRLKMPMRVVDLAYFTAEHDDYHLARVHELMGMIRAVPA
ncbi:MAG: DinB family protein [Phycisphaerales bacterium]